jgi:hypothetical protein
MDDERRPLAAALAFPARPREGFRTRRRSRSVAPWDSRSLSAMDSAAPALDERPASRFGTDAHWVEAASSGEGTDSLARGVESEPRRRATPH